MTAKTDAPRVAQPDPAFLPLGDDFPEPHMGPGPVQMIEPAEAPGEEREAAPLDAGPWEAGECGDGTGRVYVQSDDFAHDVRLYVDGDFASEQQHMDYARWVADVMTRAARPAAPTVALTGEQIGEIWVEHGCDGEDAEGFAFAAIAKFCEVNGLAAPEAGKEGGA